MNTALAGVQISPVNMEDRKQIGIKPGDTVRVHQKIQDKGKTRIQIFEGVVLARKHGTEPGATFTVRKMASGVGVEKIYPLYSPNIDKIEIVKRAKVRRAKLYFIREKVAREIKRQMRRMRMMSVSTESEAEATVRLETEAKEAEAKAIEAEADVVDTEAKVENAEAEVAETETKSEEKTEAEAEVKAEETAEPAEVEKAQPEVEKAEGEEKGEVTEETEKKSS